MKHLLTGVAIAAVLAIVAPAWAQAPANTAGTPPAPKTMPMAKKPMAKQMHHARPMRRHVAAMHHHPMANSGAGDAMTDQLNREELSRITSAAPAPTGQSAPMAAPPPAGH